MVRFLLLPIGLVGQDAGNNGLGTGVLIAAALGTTAFVGVAQVGAFDQYGRAVSESKDSEIFALAGIAVADFEFAEESQVDVGGEFLTLSSVVVGFYTMVFVVGVAVEMNANKDGVVVAVGHRGATTE